MRRRISAAAAGLGMACWSTMALALGLGDIEVRSGLNQPFVAQIPLLAISAEDAENLQAGLADNAEFERLGIERADYLSHLRFEVKPGATPYIAVSGNRPAREPFLMFLLDVRSAGSRILREYTVLLDPPTLATQGVAAADAAASSGAASSPVAPVTPAPADAPVSTPKVTFVPLPPGTVLPETPPPTPAPTPSAATAAAQTTSGVASEYGPVAAGETFWAVTVKVVRSLQNVTVDQVMLALYNANPRAFDNGSINALMKGQVLSVPSADSMRAVSPEAATAQVQALRAAAGQASAVAAAPTPTRTPRPTVTPAPTAPPATPAPTPAPTSAADSELDGENLTAPGDTMDDALAAPEADAAVDAEASAPADDMSAMSEADPLATPASGTADNRAERVAEMLATPTPAPTPAATPVPAAPPAQPSLLDTLLLPLLLLALLVVVVVAVLWRRRRASSDDRQPPAVTPSTSSSVAMPAAAAGSKSVVPDADAMADEAEAAVMAAYAKTASDGGRHRSDDAVPDFDATQVFDAPLDSGRKPVPDTTDFEATAQFSVDTVQIDLNAQDPVAEADIHLAYGLYDEAALTLTAALEKAPDDGALHAKLAEVYFAAGRPLEFVEAAEAARPHVSAADWQKLALFGSQIAPDSSLFADAGSADDGALAADLDLSFDDAEETSPAADNAPTASGGDVDFNLDFDTPATTPTDAAAGSEPQPAEAPPGDNVLDFQLDDIDAVMASTPVLDLPDDNGAAAAATAGDDTEPDNTLEFRLDDFGGDDALAPQPTSSQAADADSPLSVESPVDAPAAADGPGDGLSLPELDIETPAETPSPASGIADAGDAASVPLELDLAEFDLGVEPAAGGDDSEIEVDSATIEEFKLDDFELESDSDVISSGDEAGTKLDLARAYVDMGDNEMARVLLDEVLAQGSDAQKSDARALISRLG